MAEYVLFIYLGDTDYSFFIYRMKEAIFMANNPVITMQHSRTPCYLPLSAISYWQGTTFFYFCTLGNQDTKSQFMKQ